MENTFPEYRSERIDERTEGRKRKKKSRFLDTEGRNPGRPSSLLTQSRNPSDQKRKNGRLTIHHNCTREGTGKYAGRAFQATAANGPQHLITATRNIIPRGLTKEQKGEKGKKKSRFLDTEGGNPGRPSSLLTQSKNPSDQSRKNGDLAIRHTALESAPGNRLDGRFRPQRQMAHNI
ncbi:hypothetical protein CDAR_237911 [Caerostris darwini]|uniref:Uncharacterized protein n=1 Tax=Caerostris darwini TaxID=1538125 RepID=A0AAV4S450_9ARAC|nr:hypothetical protein CDAR_237911 [Caerostris darwini]